MDLFRMDSSTSSETTNSNKQTMIYNMRLARMIATKQRKVSWCLSISMILIWRTLSPVQNVEAIIQTKNLDLGDDACQRLCEATIFYSPSSSSSSSSLSSASSYDWLIHTPERIGKPSTPLSLAKSKVIESICWDEYKVIIDETTTTTTPAVATTIEFCGIELTNGLLHRRFLLTKKVTTTTKAKTTTTTTKLYNGFGTIDFLMTDRACQCQFDDKEEELGDEQSERRSHKLHDSDPSSSTSQRRSMLLVPENVQSMWRAMEPEATFVLNETRYVVGDWTTKKTTRERADFVNYRAFANRTDLASMIHPVPDNNDNDNDSKILRYVSHTTERVENIEPSFHWESGHRHGLNISWPPKGIRLSVDFRLFSTSSSSTNDDETGDDNDRQPVVVTLHYELYDDMPVLSKWIEITYNNEEDGEVRAFQKPQSHDDDSSDNFVILRNVTTEWLAFYPPFGSYDFYHGSFHPYKFYNGAAGSSSRPPPPQLFAFTDQAHGAQCQWVDDYFNSNDTAVDPIHTPFDMGANEPLLQCTYSSGPGVRLGSIGSNHNSRFESFRSIFLATDSTNPERQSLMKHRMTQTLVPWVTENPLFFHSVINEPPLSRNSTQHFRKLIHQMHDVGFEMLVFSFDSSFQLETKNSTYLNYIRQQVDYAKRYQIEIGGYDLIDLARGHDGYGGNVGDEYVAVDPATGSLTSNACFASGWVDKLTDMVQNFLNQTGLSSLELDGPYGGQACGSKNHSHHHGAEDSIYVQTQKQNEFMGMLRAQGVYINQPDYYFYQGGNRVAMGYDENQYSLPRWHQLTISRAGIYDDLYRLLPTQGWMFVPLSEYHGGGDAATFLGHPEELEWALAQYFGAGAGAAWRGPDLFDAPAVIRMLVDSHTRAIYKRWIGFYKHHRPIIIQPVVHLQRPTLYTWDGWMHVDPTGRNNNEIGLALIFNPTDRNLSNESLRLPMYYTGATINEELLVKLNDTEFAVRVQADYTILLVMDMSPRSIHTIVVQRADPNHILHEGRGSSETKRD